jgi:hypothetical protein
VGETELGISCPVCGEDVYEWNKVESLSGLTGATIDENGLVEPIYEGSSEFLTDLSEMIGDGYACRSFCEEKTFPLSHFVEEFNV